MQKIPSILKQNIEEYYSIEFSEKDITLLSNILEEKSYPKNKVVIQFDEPTNKFYILKKGIAGSFIENKDENFFIRTLYTEGKIFSSFSTLIKKNKTSNASYSCLTDCIVLEGDFNDLKKLIENEASFSKMYIKFLEQIYFDAENRINDLSTLNSDDRYKQLKKEIPDIDNLLPQYQIANYLNITPIQLSRVRKKIFSTQKN